MLHVICDIIKHNFWNCIGTIYSPSGKRKNYIKRQLSVRLGIEGMLVRDSPPAQSMLCPSARHVIYCSLLVQPMKTGNRPSITEHLLAMTLSSKNKPKKILEKKYVLGRNRTIDHTYMSQLI